MDNALEQTVKRMERLNNILLAVVIIEVIVLILILV